MSSDAKLWKHLFFQHPQRLIQILCDLRPINDLRGSGRVQEADLWTHSWGDLRDLTRTWCQTDPTWGRWDMGVHLDCSRSQKGEKTIPVPDILQMGNGVCGRDSYILMIVT